MSCLYLCLPVTSSHKQNQSYKGQVHNIMESQKKGPCSVLVDQRKKISRNEIKINEIIHTLLNGMTTTHNKHLYNSILPRKLLKINIHVAIRTN